MTLKPLNSRGTLVWLWFFQADLQARIAEEQSRTEGSSGVLAHLDGLPGMISPNVLGEKKVFSAIWFKVACYSFDGVREPNFYLFCKMLQDSFMIKMKFLSRVWDKENTWVPDRNRTRDLPDTDFFSSSHACDKWTFHLHHLLTKLKIYNIFHYLSHRIDTYCTHCVNIPDFDCPVKWCCS